MKSRSTLRFPRSETARRLHIDLAILFFSRLPSETPASRGEKAKTFCIFLPVLYFPPEIFGGNEASPDRAVDRQMSESKNQMHDNNSYSPGPSALGRYSAKKMAKPVNFMFMAPEAKSVSLVGDFNDWQPAACQMKQQHDGAWHAQVLLNHGHHHYLFLVDGKLTLDPRAQGTARNESDEKVSLMSVS